LCHREVQHVDVSKSGAHNLVLSWFDHSEVQQLLGDPPLVGNVEV
jgi:hypothetical protein